MNDFKNEMKQAFHVVIALFVAIAMTLFILILLVSCEKNDSQKIVTCEPVNNPYMLESNSGTF